MLKVSALFIYPVKSLGGIAVNSAQVTDRGFQYDRRWLLVDAENRFITQREFPEMALFQTSITSAGLKIRNRKNDSELSIPFQPQTTAEITVQIWNDSCQALVVSDDVNAWFSEAFSFSCKLVYMPDKTQRLVDESYAKNNEINSFSDAFPFLMIGESSLEDLNRRLTESLPMNRFRPNIVFSGADPYAEDSMRHFTINGIDFYGVKLCARCPIPTINQDNAIKGQEPLRTLASYRQRDNKIYFGQDLLHRGSGVISIGDEIMIHETANELFVEDAD
jgi:uncharacterized protein YcbX